MRLLPPHDQMHFSRASLARIMELGIPDRASRYFRDYWSAVEHVSLMSSAREPDSFFMLIRFRGWVMAKQQLYVRLMEQFARDCQGWFPELGGIGVERGETEQRYRQIAEVVFDGGP